MANNINPLFLLADSQLLFWRENDGPFLNRLKEAINTPIKAAYLGASNGDDPVFYEIFLAAMDIIDVGAENCRMIVDFSQQDFLFLEEANVILFAGGDTARGWNVFQNNGLHEKIAKRYLDGAVLIGVSAGAVQLGLLGTSINANNELTTFSTFQFAPYIIGVHEEPEWPQLLRVHEHSQQSHHAIGIPSGGGAIVYPDLSIQPVRRPLAEIDADNNLSLLFPEDDFAHVTQNQNQPALLENGQKTLH